MFVIYAMGTLQSASVSLAPGGAAEDAWREKQYLNAGHGCEDEQEDMHKVSMRSRLPSAGQ